MVREVVTTKESAIKSLSAAKNHHGNTKPQQAHT